MSSSVLLGACANLRSSSRTPELSNDAKPDASNVYDPIAAGEPVPPDYRDIIGRDDIAPIYEPRFVESSRVAWPSDTLVIGVELEGEAKAYPVSELNHREMVIDRLAGIPILVTW